MTLTMNQAAAMLGLPATKPLARLVYLSAPEGETEAEFDHRKSKERALRIGQLERTIHHLNVCIDELRAELDELGGDGQ